jgi:hypothetical protein
VGRTAEDEVDRLLAAAERLRGIWVGAWPSHFERYVVERLAELADKAEVYVEELEGRTPLYPPRLSVPKDDYDGVPSPLRGGAWFWAIHPLGKLRELVHGTDSVLPRPEVDVIVYLGDDDPQRADPVLRAVNNARIALGYVDADLVEDKKGSLWRTWRSRLKAGLGQQEVADRLTKVERAFELGFLDMKQAEVDSQEAQAFATLVQSLEQQERACVRIGSLLILKYDGQILGRTLSQIEIRALERYPAIQRNPETLLEQLATSVYQLED